MKKFQDGFSLIEIAIITVIIGLIVTAVVPRLVKNIKKETFVEGKEDLRTVRDEIVGQIIDRCCLPEIGSEDIAHITGRWGGEIYYRPDANLTCSALERTNNALSTIASSEVLLNVSPIADPIAFIVADKGEDRVFSDSTNLQTGDPVNIDTMGAGGFDDLIEYVTLDYLQTKAASNCNTPPGGGGDSGNGGDTGPPTEAHEYVQYTGNTDLNLGGSNVDGDIGANRDVNTGTGSTVNGDIVSGRDISVGSGSVVNGNVYSDRDLDVLSSGVEINGDLHAQRDIEIESGSEVNGNIYAGRDLDLLSSGVVINGDLHVQGDLYLDSGTTVNGTIYCSGTVYLDDSGCDVSGSIHAGSTVTLMGSAQVGGDIFSGRDVVLEDDTSAQVTGAVHAQRDVYVGRTTTIGGNVVAGRSIVDRGTIIGSQTPNAPESAITDPTPPTPPTSVDPPDDPSETSFSSGGSNLTPSDGDTIVPGSYRDLNIRGGRTVIFTAGNYYFRNFDSEWGASIRLQPSGGGINIFVTRDVDMDGGFDVEVYNGTAWEDVSMSMSNSTMQMAAGVYLESHRDVDFGSGSEWFGTIYASREFDFSGELLIGSYYAGHRSIFDWGAEFIYVQSDYAHDNW